MENKTIGQFIAVLRKANGMTQQELADRLNVSNKAVSRWERDACVPDLTLIPAIAETFGVSCDELLKGERIHTEATEQKADAKVERRIKSVVTRAISDFQNLCYISLALSAVGLVCMFGISYGFYRPVIAFAVMLLFEVAAFLSAAIGTNRMRLMKTENELLEKADMSLVQSFNQKLGGYSFASFFAVLSVVSLSFPLLIKDSYYTDSVISFSSYVDFAWLVLAFLVAVHLLTRKIFVQWITGEISTASVLKSGVSTLVGSDKTGITMSALQLSFVVFAGILFVIAPWFEDGQSTLKAVLPNALGLVMLAANIVCFIVFMCRHRDKKEQLLLPGIRNMLINISGFLCSGVHSAGFTVHADGAYDRYDYWDYTPLFYAVGLAAVLFAAFAAIELHRKRKKNK